MYIAFKWLVTLAIGMWLAMCFVDLYLKQSKKLTGTGVGMKQFEFILQKGKSDASRLGKTQQVYNNKDQNVMSGFHIVMFVAGALAVSAYNNKQEILAFTKRYVASLDIYGFIKKRGLILKKTAIKSSATILKCVQFIWDKIKIVLYKTISYVYALKTTKTVKENKIHVVLLNKLKEIGEERKNLGQLLIAAIQENKNIRMRYQLETMTKNRLVRHIEDTQKQIKENRTRYVSFQQLYLVTHQENTYLKARLRKLQKEKDDAEKNLMGLINEVYKSKNKELKAYCSRIIVKTKENLLNSDVNLEIQEFLEKSRKDPCASRWNPSCHSNIKITSAQSWPRCTSNRLTEIINDGDSLVPLVSDAPKLKGLPGEYVWTVQDKNGIIEKLYEYDSGPDFDNGDTIRRIRQYSVYFDKDCLLDISSFGMEHEITTGLSSISSRPKLDYPMGIQKIVTGSEAFQKFLQSNKSVVPARSPSQLLCG